MVFGSNIFHNKTVFSQSTPSCTYASGARCKVYIDFIFLFFTSHCFSFSHSVPHLQMMSQQFCLKWNNHTTNMLQVFESLLSSESLVDVTLACEGHSLKAHKMVLSACSPFFQSLFLENPCKHPIVIMKDMRYIDLKSIIDFMYRGEVNVCHEQLSALLKTAETLKVKGLAEVTGENRAGIVQQEVAPPPTTTPQQQQQPPAPSISYPSSVSTPPIRTDTPPIQGKRKRGRPRKRSMSDRSDDEGGSAAKIAELDSPDLDDLSGDASMDATSDNRPPGGAPTPSSTLNSHHTHQVAIVNSISTKSHLSSEVDETSGEENEFEVEPSKLLEQTLTTDNVPSSNQNSTGHVKLPSSASALEATRRSLSSTDSTSPALVPVSDSLQGPDSPQDIKPHILSFDDPPLSPVAGPSSALMYMDQTGVASIPGSSNFQDNNALVSHDSQPQGPFACQMCEMVYNSNRALWRHQKWHRTAKKYRKFRCEKCLYSTDSKKDFRLHEFVHSGERPFTCTECGRGFTRSNHLKRHMATHDTNFGLRCDICLKLFRRADKLSLHLRSHELLYDDTVQLTEAEKELLDALKMENDDPGLTREILGTIKM